MGKEATNLNSTCLSLNCKRDESKVFQSQKCKKFGVGLYLTATAVTQTSDFTPASSKEFLDIQATTGCRFTLKRVRDMI